MVKVLIIVIIGFFGVGKIMLICYLLQNVKGCCLVLVINEFGDVGVDGELVKGCNDVVCFEEDIVELVNGCICCIVVDDFLLMMQKLFDWFNLFEYIIIEISGLVLFKLLVKVFQWFDICICVMVDGVVVLIDVDVVVVGCFVIDEVVLVVVCVVDFNFDYDSLLEELFEE